jgi:glycosyltransferase involved in cell wall biosynthesis
MVSDRLIDAVADQQQASLRIAVVTETYPPEINGVANTMRQLVQGLARRGHRLTLIRPRQRRDRDMDEPADSTDLAVDQWLVPGLPLPGYRGLRFGLPVYWRLRRRWQHDAPDAVYIATEGPLGRAALEAARQLDIAALTGFHTQFHQYSRFYGLGLLMQPIARSLRRFHNRSDGTLVPTSALGRELEGQGFEAVHVFSRGVDTRLFSPERRSEALRARWGCDESTLVVLYVGRIAAEKNIGLVLDAFHAIGQRRPDARFVLVGDGPESSRLATLHPGYIFAGAKVGVELAEHYASADLFLFPSLTETFGNVVTEAMASGLPVVAFDYAAAHEHLRSAENGILVPFGDSNAFVGAAAEAAGNPHELRRLGRAAAQTAQGLDWDQVIRGVEQRLRDAIAWHRQPGDQDEVLATTLE